MIKHVMFACVHNAGRSQMAAGFFNKLAEPTLARASSAGTAPGQRVHPGVVEVMLEVGVDLSGVQPRLLTADLARDVAYLVTMGCGEACPIVRGVQREDWPFPDPKDRSPDDVRRIRDDVAARVDAFIRAHGWGRAS